ncbi:MAG: LicD family protein [Butyrivibrio sp.]|nr:LicD family protein [Butyrivibrio sp.]
MTPEKKTCKLNSLKFPKEFFEDEVRNGFVVTSMMKRYWASQLKVLAEIASICDRHGIRWYADNGTLIGAVRHEGYIPWDDDLDICMLRSDFLRFFEIAETELPKEYKILTMEKEPDYKEIIGRIVNSTSINYSEAHLSLFYGCPYTVGVDIFPLDGLYDDEEKEKARVERTRRVLDALSLVKGEALELQNGSESRRHAELNSQIELMRILSELEEREKINFDREADLERQLNLLAEKLYSECSDTEAKNVALMPFYIPKGNHIYNKSFYKNSIELPFENTFINAPARYEEVLDVEYGDFMQICKSGGLHEYPVYADQERLLAQKIGHNPYRYTFNIMELLQSVKRYTGNLLARKSPDRGKEILFLPVKAKWWKTMEDVYLDAKADERNTVKVIPIPWYECDALGNIGRLHDERALFPESVETLSYEEYGFEGKHVDCIVVQVPYDGWSCAITLPEFFYSNNLLQMTDELVYVPYFDAADPDEEGDKASVALTYLIEQPVVVSADKIILKSEKLRQLYLDTLIKKSGEETRVYWENKIKVFGESAEKESIEKAPVIQTNEDTDDNDWNALVGNTDGRKVIVYYITISMLLKGREKAIDKIKRSLDIFEDAKDKVTTIILPQDKISDDLKEIDPDLYNEFEKIAEDIIPAKANCVYDKHGISLNHIEKWNAFYGDRGAVPMRCVELGIPVMIENMDI